MNRFDDAFGFYRVMERLTQDREIGAVFLNRRIFDIAQTIFEILETVLLCQLRTKRHHFR